jgi:uncharacterized RDD family membrane protein YckC
MSQDLEGHYAGFVSRLIAYFLDGIVIIVSLGATAWLIQMALSVLRLQSVVDLPVLSDSGQFVLTSTTAAIIVIFYRIFFWSVAGQTPGLKFMGLRVVTLDGKHLSLKRAALRMVGYVISTVPLYLGFAWVLIDDRRQGWHDKLARTCVIYDWDARYGGRVLTRALDRREERLQDQAKAQSASAPD